MQMSTSDEQAADGFRTPPRASKSSKNSAKKQPLADTGAEGVIDSTTPTSSHDGTLRSLKVPSLKDQNSMTNSLDHSVDTGVGTPESTAYFRQQNHPPESFISDSLVFDSSMPSPIAASPTSSSPQENNNPPMHNVPMRKMNTANLADDSILMDLSESEDEIIIRAHSDAAGTTKNDSADNPREKEFPRYSTFESEYNAEQSADDEMTDRQPNQAKNSAIPEATVKRQHQRRRSGDAAAAALATGGSDWVGMKMDNIPMPEKGPHDDEDDDENEEDAKDTYDQEEPIPQQWPAHQPPILDASRAQLNQQPVQQFIPPPPSMHTPSSSIPGFNPPPSFPYNAHFHGYPPPHPPPMNHFHASEFHPQPPPLAHHASMRDMYAHTHHQPYGFFSHSMSEIPQWQGENVEQRRRSWGHTRQSSLRSIHSTMSDQASHQSDVASKHSHSTRGSAAVVDGDEGSQFDESSENSSEREDEFDSDHPMPVKQNQLLGSNNLFDSNQLDRAEHDMEDRSFRGAYQNVVRSRNVKPGLSSPFSKIGKKTDTDWTTSRKSFFPQTSLADEGGENYPTFICPKCKTRQRTFFSVLDAPKQLEGPTGYLAFYFVLYVTASLFIFGLEEGWAPLDCIYFAVISLTTAGLGDYVPTTDSNKIICSIFIYFGVACIGLLLGSYIAGMLDDKAYTDAKRKQAEACPNCARIDALKQSAARRSAFPTPHPPQSDSSASDQEQVIAQARHFSSEHIGMPVPEERREGIASYKPIHRHSASSDKNGEATRKLSWADQSLGDLPVESPPPAPTIPPPIQTNPGTFYQSPPVVPSPSQANILGSPLTREILGRQSHTRHASFDIGQKNVFNPDGTSNVPQSYVQSTGGTPFRTPQPERASEMDEENPFRMHHKSNSARFETQASHVSTRSASSHHSFANMTSDLGDHPDDDSSSVSTVDMIVDERLYRIKATRYVFMTLQEALGNSLVILAVGCVGFYLIENFTLVDSWYFTTVLLTTTGYGDIVPVTHGGKLFATIYLLVGGTILLNNMSMISMIPLELRKRRIERAVLTQFGDSLDDDALKELATGPLIQRLSLTAVRSDGLAECTREMFALAMLVRLGKVSEDDIKQTFAAFRRLDHNDEGVLNSKSIISGMINRRRSTVGLSQLGRRPTMHHPRSTESDNMMRGFFMGRRGSVHVQTAHGGYQFTSTPTAQPNEGSALLSQTTPTTYMASPQISPHAQQVSPSHPQAIYPPQQYLHAQPMHPPHMMSPQIQEHSETPLGSSY